MFTSKFFFFLFFATKSDSMLLSHFYEIHEKPNKINWQKFLCQDKPIRRKRKCHWMVRWYMGRNSWILSAQANLRFFWFLRHSLTYKEK